MTLTVNKVTSKIKMFKTFLNPINSRIKWSFKIFQIQTLRLKSFSILPPPTLYDEYIDRSKLPEHKNGLSK